MSNLSKQQCSICGSPDHTHLHCYGMQAQDAISSKNRSLDHRLRNKVGGFLLEPDTADGGDTLAIALCSYFEKHMHRPKDDPESENGWGQWAEEKTNAALDALTRVLSGDSLSAHSEIERLCEENQSLRNLADNLRPGPISQALQDSPDYSGQTIERLRAALVDVSIAETLKRAQDVAIGTLSGASSAPETSLSGKCVWMPVSERLPTEDGYYWCYLGRCPPQSYPQQAIRFKEGRWWTSWEVSHWRPLFDAPSAEETSTDGLPASWKADIERSEKASGEPIYECCNESCLWRGLESETVHPKHEPSRFLCPECHEVVELV